MDKTLNIDALMSIIYLIIGFALGYYYCKEVKEVDAHVFKKNAKTGNKD